MSSIKLSLTILLLSVFCLPILSQDSQKVIQNYLQNNQKSLGVNLTDIQSWVITDEYFSKSTQVTHVYIRQVFNGIEVVNGRANFNILEGKVFSMGNRLVGGLTKKITGNSPSVQAKEAVQIAFVKNDIGGQEALQMLKKTGATSYLFHSSESLEDIPVRLVYYAINHQDVRLCWDLSIYPNDAAHWWSIKVDAISGEIIAQNDWVTHCEFDTSSEVIHKQKTCEENSSSEGLLNPPFVGAYNVFPIPVESPVHGDRSLVVNPEFPLASPYGWHDTNGSVGNEFTTTRGNNVYAYEDMDDNNQAGFSPDGGATLDFNFPLDLNLNPEENLSSSITNLFYMNNIMHDVWYNYGFDEAAGNFQQNNYGNGGQGSDYVNAEGQDGSGENNANFATPPDGGNPRMQMYIWAATASNVFHVNAPPSATDLDILYTNSGATFGPPIPTEPLTVDLALVTDGGIDPYDACQSITNSSEINNKIAVIRRGTCLFVEKIQSAQNAGAVAVIIVNNVGGDPVTMAGDTGGITIPSIMLPQAEGQALIDALANGDLVNGTIVDDSNQNPSKDSDFDNGIIAHEYGHGISIRLTGGPSDVDCLSNDEQMGEGWSDWFGLMLTMEPGDLAEDVRGVGAFVRGEGSLGNGIRPAPYSTSFAINYYTYDDTNYESQLTTPHGVGFVWCTMLWDLNWAFIDEYGYDPDVYAGTGGNNMVMQLVMDGMKLQPCNPGFVDGRDAILEADQLLYAGANQCLIWSVFANRGLGWSADQGSPWSRTDQTEAFDTPASVNNSYQTVTICEGESFTVGSNTYTTSGTYVDTFVQADGCESTTTTILYVIEPVAIGLDNSTLFVVNPAEDVTYQWINCATSLPVSGATDSTFNPDQDGSYAVEMNMLGCLSTSACIDVILSDVGELESNEMSIFPNPSSAIFEVDLNGLGKVIALEVRDARGRIVFKEDNVTSSHLVIDLTSESNGIYTLQIIQNKQVFTRKIIKG